MRYTIVIEFVYDLLYNVNNSLNWNIKSIYEVTYEKDSINPTIIPSMCTLLTPCSSSDGKGSGIGKVKQTNKELTIKIQDYEKLIFESAIKTFKEKYPDVKVNVEVVADDGEGAENYIKNSQLKVQIYYI